MKTKINWVLTLVFLLTTGIAFGQAQQGSGPSGKPTPYVWYSNKWPKGAKEIGFVIAKPHHWPTKAEIKKAADFEAYWTNCQPGSPECSGAPGGPGEEPVSWGPSIPTKGTWFQRNQHLLKGVRFTFKF